MSIQPTEVDRKAARWLTKGPRMLGALIDLLFVTLLLDLPINVVANQLALPRFLKDYISSLDTWILHNGDKTLLLLVIVVLVRMICLLQIKYAGTELPPTDRKVEHYYLNFIKEERKTLAPEGLPPRLAGLSTQLDAIFITPEFYPNRPLTDHPPSEEEISAANVSPYGQSMWRFTFDKSDIIDFSTLWKRLTKEKPAAIIQGYPGIGKSTLLNGLALYMAERRLNRWQHRFERTLSVMKMPDAVVSKFRTQKSQGSGFTALEAIESPLVPILINLRTYAEEKPKSSTNPMADYLQRLLTSQCQKPASFLQKCLQIGSCLIMFDGLDEVSKDLRATVQKDIVNFIRYCRTQENYAIDFNRFLITSRVADYDQNAFPEQNYSHYIIADLKLQQIQDLINKYYVIYTYEQYSVLPSQNQPSQNQSDLADKAKKRADRLSLAIKQDQHIGDLAKRPLLLYLLIVVQANQANQETVNLPRQRIQLYTIAIRLLLENHSSQRNLQRIEEEKAVQCLGLLAAKMIDKSISFMSYDEAINSLRESQSMTKEEADDFLKLVRVRSGLFVERIENGYSFYHQTFRDYFAARYKLCQVDGNLDELKLFVNKALDNEEWRAPFRLAVAYESYENGGKELTNDLMRELLSSIPGANNKNRVSALLFSAECMLEAKGAIIEDQLKETIIKNLIQSCTGTLQDKDFVERDKIGEIIIRRISRAIEEHSLPLTEGIFSKYASLLALSAEQPLVTIYDIFERVLQPAGSTTNTPPSEEDIEKLAHSTGEWLVALDLPDEIRDLMLETLRNSPPRSASEINFLRHLSKNTPDRAIQDACACALKKCILNTADTVDAMQYVAKSSLPSISEAANTWLKAQKQNQTH